MDGGGGGAVINKKKEKAWPATKIAKLGFQFRAVGRASGWRKRASLPERFDERAAIVLSRLQGEVYALTIFQ